MNEIEKRKKMLEIHSNLNTILEIIKIFKENTSGDFSFINCKLDSLNDIENNYKTIQVNQQKNINELRSLNIKINNLENRLIENTVKDDIKDLMNTIAYYYQGIINSIDTTMLIEKNSFKVDSDKFNDILNALDDTNKMQVVKYAEFLLSQQC